MPKKIVGQEKNWETFESLLGNDTITKIDNIYKKMKSDSEFEIMFYNYNSTVMSYEKFLSVMEYLTLRQKQHKLVLESTDTLDIVYNKEDTLESFRITIVGLEKINQYIKMLHNRKNHVIFTVLLSMLLEGTTGNDIKLIKKTRNRDNILDIDDFNIRVRMTEEVYPSKKEIEMLQALTEVDRKFINFRYKQRVSLITKGSEKEDAMIRIDLTNTKTSSLINKLDFIVPRYELEVELGIKKTPKKEYLTELLGEVEKILKVIQQSNFIVSQTIANKVLNDYSQILSTDIKNSISLDGRQPISLEIQHVTEILPNKYAVTDKADGDRFFLIISDNSVYLISQNLSVKGTGIILPDDKSNYNGSILDGEYIFLPKQNRHMFMVFDCLHKGNENIRKISSFIDRIKHADEIIKECFILGDQKGFNIEEYNGAFDTNKIMKFHSEQIKKNMDATNHDIPINKIYPMIRRKYFIASMGGADNEIFKYSFLMWNKYVFDKEINCPYHLDGLIYHPLNQEYTTSVRESRFSEYKWKPPEKNSIDFFIQFERNRDTGKIFSVYDNSMEEYIENKPYRICHLYVGQRSKQGEQPVLFQKDTRNYLSYLFLKNGEVRDLQGNILQDRTVVEFYYNNDMEVDDKFRWVPIRTRYDKTESVMRYRRKYGNYIDTANKIWRSIINPIIMKDMEILSNDQTYQKQMEILRGKIGHELIITASKENVYFQIRTNLAKPMRNFHNWLKSIIIYTHCHPMYQNNKQLSVLDIGVGRGADIMKFYYSKADFFVGIDIDKEGLVSAVDGALSRYNQLRKTHPNFPKMYFIQADAGALLNYEDQVRALGSMTKDNQLLIEKYFPVDKNKKVMFDRINCEFAIHYFLANQTVWDNFCENISNHLKPGGYIMITVFDAQRITDALKDKGKFTSYYNNTKGEKKTFFEIIKKYEDVKPNEVIGLGQAIDLHNSLISREDVYITEYLVDKRFLEAEFDKKCDMELIDTDLFENQFEIHRNYFEKVVQFESVDETRQFLQTVGTYYNQKDEINNASFKITRLYRYLVFRKRDATKNNKIIVKKEIPKEKDTSKPIKSKLNKRQRGGQINEIFDTTKYNIKDKDVLNNYSYQSALLDILKSNDIVPDSSSVPSFYDEELKIGLVLDSDLDDNKMTSINKKLQIDHEIGKKKKSILNGVNVFILEKDCNDYTDVKLLEKNDREPYVVLYYDGDKYAPVYRKISEGSMMSFYKADDKLVQHLKSEAD
ncbi:MAG: mRNA capping enzyme [Edafosvirus sp.]|uniref:mRNA capping enzyme n=1 Tax=Edafosvirus sp. TaxID=2487765 RepID=A0A3G4ZV36_9VIRU|nr:MAG: mRNA capping enzyme [Edafosvirus sp.]